MGINWSFAESEADADSAGSLAVRVCACLVSIGGMLVTALMLGIVSGECWLWCDVSCLRGGGSALWVTCKWCNASQSMLCRWHHPGRGGTDTHHCIHQHFKLLLHADAHLPNTQCHQVCDNGQNDVLCTSAATVEVMFNMPGACTAAVWGLT